MVRSLIEVNKTGLLNSNITNVTAAPLEVQAEASGQEYKASGESGPRVPDILLTMLQYQQLLYAMLPGWQLQWHFRCAADSL